MRSEGKLSQYPVAAAHWDELEKVFQFYQRAISGGGWEYFVNKDGFFRKAGWPAHTLLDAMLSDAGNTEGTVLTEYSGHDTTLMPLYAAMGNYSWVYPQFATSVVFEVYSNPTKSSDPFVVVKTALPDQLPGSHPLTWFDYEVTCMDATSGQIYTSTAGCPLSDLKAFASTRRGTETAKLGGCYAFPSDLVDTQCTDKTGKRPLRGPCKDYRAACPLLACGEGYYMKPDYSCNPLGQ